MSLCQKEQVNLCELEQTIALRFSRVTCLAAIESLSLHLPPSSEIMLPKTFYKHLFSALFLGLGLRIFLVWRFPFASGDTPYL
jgi:hypothetical protein